MKIVWGFTKIIFMLICLGILNPHRVLLALVHLIAAVISFIAWKLEDLANFMGKGVKKGMKKFWLFGEKLLSEPLHKEIEKLDIILKQAEKKLNPNNVDKGEDDGV
ncbi:hypothetical protein A54_259 [Septuagintavirus sv54]|uniref:Uncharacterized protein n=1 Tax=Escherichia phage A5-4 TaxID=2996162 RepID=A0AAE9PQZ0_9CAUD|nr:hypothetical protein A54_259 [Escherichia phage A5-4]